MRAGTLRTLLLIQRNDGAKNDLGEPDPAGPWTTVVELWGDIQGLSAREIESAAQRGSRVSHQITTRYCTGVDASMRVKVKGGVATDIYEIRGITNVEHRNRELMWMVDQGPDTQNAGPL